MSAAGCHCFDLYSWGSGGAVSSLADPGWSAVGGEPQLAGPISHTSTRCMDYVEIFNIILDLSITCFFRFSGC